MNFIASHLYAQKCSSAWWTSRQAWSTFRCRFWLELCKMEKPGKFFFQGFSNLGFIYYISSDLCVFLLYNICPSLTERDLCFHLHLDENLFFTKVVTILCIFMFRFSKLLNARFCFSSSILFETNLTENINLLWWIFVSLVTLKAQLLRTLVPNES